MSDVAYRANTDPPGALSPEDDWFSDPEDAVAGLEAPEWFEPEAEPELVTSELRRRQVAVVLAVLVAVVLVAGAILGVRALTGSGDGSKQAAPEAPAGTVTTPVTTTPAATTPQSPTGTTTTPEQAPAPAAGASSVPTDTVLRPGASGDSIKALQEALTTLGLAPGKADGIYGPTTTEAVTAFQTSKGLTADGIAGPRTIAAVNEALAAG